MDKVWYETQTKLAQNNKYFSGELSLKTSLEMNWLDVLQYIMIPTSVFFSSNKWGSGLATIH
jgi:hypothetical protein